MGLVTCYDAYDATQLPPQGTCFLAYQHNLALVHARFPHARKVWTITTDADPEAYLWYDGIDCESGDASEWTAAQWCENKIRAHLGRPWVYAQLARHGAVVEELAVRGLRFGVEVDSWMARWLDSPRPPTAIRTGMDDGYQWGTGNVAWQYYRQGRTTYDISVVDEAWAFPAPPAPAPAPHVPNEASGTTLRKT